MPHPAIGFASSLVYKAAVLALAAPYQPKLVHSCNSVTMSYHSPSQWPEDWASEQTHQLCNGVTADTTTANQPCCELRT